jgi:HD-like signal output (HDOD) protein
MIDKIAEISKKREMGRNLLEDLSAGLNHAEIGALIAEKWNFPEELIDSIKYHHEPEAAPPDRQEIVETIYFANSIANYEEKEIVFEQISRNILKKFGITTEEQLNIILSKLAEAFDRENAGERQR